MTNWQNIVKGTIDRVGSLCLLAMACPVFIMAAAIIKIFSKGPLIFTQERIGLNEQPFTIYKFRTMHVHAAHHAFGTVTVQNDARLFPGAKLLRKFKIDELPQLLNVLNGTMSIVGPRPTVAEDHERMDARQRKRSIVKPGLTGLAQIRGGAALPWPQRIEHDLAYIQGYSLRLDATILLTTAWLVLLGRADKNPPNADEWAAEEPSEATSQVSSQKRAA